MGFFAGVDLGSTAGKAVVMTRDEAGELKVAGQHIVSSGFKPTVTAREALEGALRDAGVTDVNAAMADIEGLCATGYGREKLAFSQDSVSEISCHAKGATFMNPAVRTIIDVGGQDVKAILCDKNGRVKDFAMNDKCAAGTGKFFEAMARTLRCTVPELGEFALEATESVIISNQCSVFAESEVITLINDDVSRENISAGIHDSIARRLVGMATRLGVTPEVLLTGGCAKNPALRKSLEEMLHVKLLTPDFDPQVTGALGAAIFAAKHMKPPVWE